MGGVAGKKLVHGWGINDAGYPVNLVVNGKQVMCPFYKVWKDMLRRCHSESFKLQNPAYEGCSISLDWKYFSNFKSWMEQQDWEGNQLDKDILIIDNRIYSSETCLFVPRDVNAFFTCEKKSSDSPIGCFLNSKGVYVVSVGGNKHRVSLGSYKSAKDALTAWATGKMSMAVDLENKHPRLRGLITAKTKHIIDKQFDKLQSKQEKKSWG